VSVQLSRVAALELGTYRLAASICGGALALCAAAPLGAERRLMARERLGRWRRAGAHGARPAIWVHAASLGETRTAAPLMARIRRACPAARIVLTYQTPAARAAARETAADETHYFPVDTPRVLERVLSSLRPRLFLFVETEIWPSLLLTLADREVPAAMVTASVSARSYRRYTRVRALMGAALGTLSAVCARDRASEERLLALGAARERTVFTGDLKLDALPVDVAASTPDLLVAVDDPLLLAASTHAGEDEQVLAAFAAVRAGHRAARLVLAPRHPTRAQAVARAAEARGFAVDVWSAPRRQARWDVLVVDTTGELGGFMKRAAAVFVGGSLVAAGVGGHNLLEPAAFARPIAAGPDLEGVRDQADILTAGRRAHGRGKRPGPGGEWSARLDDPAAARERGLRALAALRAQSGALERTWAALLPLFVRAGLCGADAHEDDAVAG
jgi:3-deoxy-D-manno-octulosonic-acid transferase